MFSWIPSSRPLVSFYLYLFWTRFNVYFLAIPISDAIWTLMLRYAVYMFCLPVLFVFCQWCVRTSAKVEPSLSKFFKIPPNEKQLPQNPPAAGSKLFSIYNFIPFDSMVHFSRWCKHPNKPWWLDQDSSISRCKTNSGNMGVSDPGSSMQTHM